MNWGGRGGQSADGADSIIVGGIQDWADWRTGERNRVRNPGRDGLGRTGGMADWRTQQTTKFWTGRTGRMGRMGAY